MQYVVQYGDTLWEIARKCLGDPTRWQEIARQNHLENPDILFVGQQLWLPAPIGRSQAPWSTTSLGGPTHRSGSTFFEERPAKHFPARTYFFVVADEINPFTRKLVRKVVFPKDLQGNPELVKRILSPEAHGFQPIDPHSKVSMGRHILGRTDSKYISASERPFGAARFGGKRYWIDANKVRQAGGLIHEAKEVAEDLARIAAKTKDAKFLKYIDDIRHKSLVLDKEVLIEGEIAAKAVKGAGAMGLTRGLQVVQGVGLIVSVYDLGQAGMQSYHQGSVKPIAAESVRQVGGWAAGWAGMKLGTAAGALVGIETGPGAVLTAVAGGLVGGVAGYFGFDWIADHIHEN